MKLKDSAITVVATLVTIGAMILVIASCATRSYYYNAYSNEFDEYFVIKSNAQLPIDTLVNFDSHAKVGANRTGYTAYILSTYHN